MKLDSVFVKKFLAVKMLHIKTDHQGLYSNTLPCSNGLNYFKRG